MVHPLPGDHRHKILIEGEELAELKKHTYSMSEAFGLDRKLESYQGTRPITSNSRRRKKLSKLRGKHKLELLAVRGFLGHLLVER